jgi:hypothetical protein
MLAEHDIGTRRLEREGNITLLAFCGRGQELVGGEGQNRTGDTTIFSRMLYQLSYLAPR